MFTILPAKGFVVLYSQCCGTHIFITARQVANTDIGLAIYLLDSAIKLFMSPPVLQFLYWIETPHPHLSPLNRGFI